MSFIEWFQTNRPYKLYTRSTGTREESEDFFVFSQIWMMCNFRIGLRVSRRIKRSALQRLDIRRKATVKIRRNPYFGFFLWSIFCLPCSSLAASKSFRLSKKSVLFSLLILCTRWVQRSRARSDSKPRTFLNSASRRSIFRLS